MTLSPPVLRIYKDFDVVLQRSANILYPDGWMDGWADGGSHS